MIDVTTAFSSFNLSSKTKSIDDNRTCLKSDIHSTYGFFIVNSQTVSTNLS